MQNELTLKDGQVGFMKEEPEPKTFLSIDSIEKVYIVEQSIYNTDLINYPTYETHFELSTSKKEYEREAYTILELLGDFGGFNDALLLLVGIISSFYSS